MELELIRAYFPNGTNGEIFHNHVRVCYSIELPWLDNQYQISCVPEGRYELIKRYSQKFGSHLQLMNVPNRNLILIHSANDAMKELKGCIAPVSLLTAEGKGNNSKVSLKRLLAFVYPELEEGNKVFITIKSKAHE